ncbi:MAG: DUF6314 family protein [Acidimicrobiales bacterium]
MAHLSAPPTTAETVGRGDLTPPASFSSRQRLPLGDLAAYLCGRWSLERDVAGPSAEAGTSFSGWAEFTPGEPGLLDYTEHGTLSLESATFEARRALAYRLLGATSAEVRFRDGELFHLLDLSTGRSRPRYECGADRYLGLYLVNSADCFVVRWRVNGPRKSYVSTTRYSRLHDDARIASSVLAPTAEQRGPLDGV